MKINLIAIGKKMPSWIEAGFEEYVKRFTKDISLHLIEVPAVKHSKNVNVETIIKTEGERILRSIPKNNEIIALDVKGQEWSSEQLAQQIEQWQVRGRDVSLLIGGPEGLSEDCLKMAKTHWSLSQLTFPHPLVRIIVAEQLYRAISILKGHPYHRSDVTNLH
ncbi:MAG: 23S rRNA (pseudouridine(1915)-N(3))-methyltransferase RlmH [Gammaproteobacteria bacterium]|nr:23S rRNA (pseudouridine(1915)-N(3))-methyltransferase RlmH [Gammaproteobacteria bacterium]